MNPSPSLSPAADTDRLHSLDVLRGVALLGILLMNIAAFGLHYQAYGDPTVMGGAEGWNLRSWIVTNMFFEGTMRGMFSMLFGVGMVLMTTRMEQRGAGVTVADIYYRRTLWLLVFGVIHAYLFLWFGEILFAYGLFGMFLFPFRHSTPRKLIIGVAALILFGVVLNYYQYHKATNNFRKYNQAQAYSNKDQIPADIREGKEAWEGIVAEAKPDKKKKDAFVSGMHGDYISLVLHLAPINRMVQTLFNYDYNPWDVLPMMLLGIALFKWKVITAELSYRAYLIMTLVGYAIGLSINYYETMLLLNNNFSVPAILRAGLTYPFGRVAVAMGHIGLIMIFCKLQVLPLLKSALAATGKMALTNYVMHSVICAFIFTGIGLSLYGRLQRYELYYVVLFIWIFQLVVSPVWLKYFQFGPLEWLWRSLTYQKRQPFRRVQPQPVLATENVI